MLPVALVLFLFGGCAGPVALLRQNSQAMVGLQPGMSEEQLRTRMGTSPVDDIPNPYRSELYRAGDQQIKILYYYTNRRSADGIIDDDELTPFVFVDGLLDGWGWSYLGDVAERYDIRIRIRR